MTFADLLPYDTFRDLLKAESTAGEDHRHIIYRPFLDDVMVPALVAHLRGLHASGRMVRMDGYDGRHFNFLDSWNAILDGATEEHLWRWISGDIAHHFLFDATYRPVKRIKGGEDLEDVATEAWNKLVLSVDAGDIDPIEFNPGWSCGTTGERLYVGFDDWKPSLFVLDKDYKLVDAGPIEAPGIETVDVTFPTGHLLIADWIRITAFTEACRPSNAFDINCDRGMREAIRFYAEELGFASVFVGNTCPRVFRNGDEFVVGKSTYDEENDDFFAPNGMTDIGFVCTDLWWATIIDRETLLDILSKTMSREAAEAEVEDYLKKHDLVIQAKVEPGRWRVSFCGDNELFAKLADESGLTPKRIEAYFTMSPVVD